MQLKKWIWLIAALTQIIPAGAQGQAMSQSAIAQRLAEAEKRLADWPELARYRSENAQLAAAPSAQARVVFIGDSITDFWGRSSDAGVFFPGKPYLNRGISGQTTPQMLIRFRADVIALKPRVVVILAGTNDIGNGLALAAIEDNLTSMCELAQANGIKVVVASILPINDYIHPEQSVYRPTAKILEINAWIKAYAQRKGLVYLDYYDAMLDANKVLKRELSDDGLHPNAAGYAVMQPLAQRSIDRALAR
jgi:lysophospholipase L1-like esterase